MQPSIMLHHSWICYICRYGQSQDCKYYVERNIGEKVCLGVLVILCFLGALTAIANNFSSLAAVCGAVTHFLSSGCCFLRAPLGCCPGGPLWPPREDPPPPGGPDPGLWIVGIGGIVFLESRRDADAVVILLRSSSAVDFPGFFSLKYKPKYVEYLTGRPKNKQ